MNFDKSTAITGAQLIRDLYAGLLAPTINERSTDTQVLVKRIDERTFVAFPGTNSLRDLRTDLRASKREWQSGTFGPVVGRVHSGFARCIDGETPDQKARRSAAQSIMPALMGELINSIFPEPAVEIVLVGHSLGGALAMLAAHRLMVISGISLSVYTYGQPRVGNGSFTRHYNANLNDRTWRIVNADDPVPYLPPWLLGFRHAGREVFLDKSGGLEIERSLFSQLATTTAAAGQGYATGGAASLASISAHGIGAYLKKLQA